MSDLHRVTVEVRSYVARERDDYGSSNEQDTDTNMHYSFTMNVKSPGDVLDDIREILQDTYAAEHGEKYSFDTWNTSGCGDCGCDDEGDED